MLQYLNAGELEPLAVTHDPLPARITAQRASFSWGEQQPALNNLQFTVEEGSLVAVVGRVGSGKAPITDINLV